MKRKTSLVRGFTSLTIDISDQDFHFPDLSVLGLDDVVSKFPDTRVRNIGALTGENRYRVVRNHRLHPSDIPYSCLAANQPAA